MKNLKLHVTILLLSISSLSFAQNSTGVIKGEILNSDHQPVFGATIKITQAGVLIGGTTTDEEGHYTYKPLNPGNYELIVSSFETQTKKITDIRVSGEITTYVDVAVSTNTLMEVEVVAYCKPLVEKTFMKMKEISGKDLQVMAVERGNFIGAVINISSEATQGSDGQFHVRGGRGDATAYIVDGVKSPNISGVPALAVENLAVITGGIPAQYGDNTSGVIVITTKDYFTGMQDKRMRDNYILENKEKVKREKEAIQAQKKRKKEIEEELRLEQEAKTQKG
ncbi:MAG: carboxypeptidase regulatory-like domain-containing protein [Bacteroidota bacterium]